jgi:hypothetical protein
LSINKTYNSGKLLAVLVASMVTMAVSAKQPKLVVGIVVDGLQQEYIDLLKEQFGTSGFNRLLREGVVLENVDYGTNLDPAAATAVVMTGAAPSINGIASAMHYDVNAKRHVLVVDDKNTVGNFTDQTYSPKALRVTTLSDEARIAGAGVTYAYSIAPDATQAILMAGHAANSAVWFNERTGNWAGTTYYSEFPNLISNHNRLTPLASRLDTMQWVPSAKSKNTDFLPDHLTHYPFRYTFPRSNVNRFAAFKSSPLINDEVTNLALEYIKALQLGKHDGPDMLNLAYSLQPYEFTKTSENRYELIDGYVKLDAYLGRLLSTIDSQIGRDNALVFLTATPPSSRRRKDDEKWNVPSGEFSTRKAVSLLNLYLIALHGNGDWIKAFADDGFFLNETLINERNEDIRVIRQEAADFLKRMSGVDRAYTIDAILNASTTADNAEAMRRNTVVSVAGDVHVELAPGWELVDDYNMPGQRTGKVTINALTTAPAFILAPGIKPEIIKTIVDARVIAPTVAGQMHIRSPNGASLAPLRF